MLNKKHILIYILTAGIIFTLTACSKVTDTRVSTSAASTRSSNFKAPDLPDNIDHEPPSGMGFDISNEDVFEKETGQERFKFNVDMVATAKAVKENNDESFTLGDMLDIYYGRKTYAVYDRSSLQWNKFVKDFCSDPSTDIYPNRLNAAAALWKIVRDSDMPKEYIHELFERNKDKLKV